MRRPRLTAVAAALLLASCASRGEVVPPTAAGPRFTLLSYNVNYGLAGDPWTLDAIRASGADIAILQETNEAWEEALAGLYPHRAYVHRPAAGGLGVLSRFPFEDHGVLEPPPGGWFPAWLLVFQTPVGQVQVLDVHLRPPSSDDGSVVSGYLTTPAVREAEIAAHLERLDPALPAVVAGDFNEGPGGAAVELARTRGFRLAPIEADTWRWRTSVGTISGRLDHVLHDARLGVLEARVLESGRSDHFPIFVALGLARPEARRGTLALP